MLVDAYSKLPIRIPVNLALQSGQQEAVTTSKNSSALINVLSCLTQISSPKKSQPLRNLVPLHDVRMHPPHATTTLHACGKNGSQTLADCYPLNLALEHPTIPKVVDTFGLPECTVSSFCTSRGCDLRCLSRRSYRRHSRPKVGGFGFCCTKKRLRSTLARTLYLRP